jgi:hypothetical protein
LRYKDYLLFNKNILIGFVCAFSTGAITSQLVAPKSTYALNSLIALIAEDLVFYTVFGILLYLDNRRKNESIKQKQQQYSTRINSTRFGNIKWLIIKLASTMSVAEVEYNIVKPYVHYWLLTQQRFEPFVASVIASLVGISGFIAVADLMAHYTRLFKKKA